MATLIQDTSAFLTEKLNLHDKPAGSLDKKATMFLEAIAELEVREQLVKLNGRTNK